MPPKESNVKASEDQASWNNLYRVAYAEGEEFQWGKEPDKFVVWVSNYLKKKKFKNAVVLDVGCGEGRHCIYLARKGYVMHGIDIALTAIRKGQKWSKKEGLQRNVNLLVGDAEELPYHDGFFDVVLDFHTLEFVRKKKQYIKEVARVLNSGGLFFIRTAKSPPLKSHSIRPGNLKLWLKGKFERDYWDDSDYLEAVVTRI